MEKSNIFLFWNLLQKRAYLICICSGTQPLSHKKNYHIFGRVPLSWHEYARQISFTSKSRVLRMEVLSMPSNMHFRAPKKGKLYLMIGTDEKSPIPTSSLKNR